MANRSGLPNGTRQIWSMGFTLIELLVTIAILAVIASLLFPALTQVRRATDKLVCTSNLRQIGIALFAHADDHEQRFPRHNNSSCSSWPYIFGDWATGRYGTYSTFYQAYLPGTRKLFYCPVGLRWQRNQGSEVWHSYQTFPATPPTGWISAINYTYFSGPNENGTNSRGGPISTAQATSRSTLISDVMRFGESAPYTNARMWNHFGRPYIWGAQNEINDASGGNLLHGDGHVGWIGGVAELLANRQKMKGNNNNTYAATQNP